MERINKIASLWTCLLSSLEKESDVQPKEIHSHRAVDSEQVISDQRSVRRPVVWSVPEIGIDYLTVEIQVLKKKRRGILWQELHQVAQNSVTQDVLSASPTWPRGEERILDFLNVGGTLDLLSSHFRVQVSASQNKSRRWWQTRSPQESHQETEGNSVSKLSPNKWEGNTFSHLHRLLFRKSKKTGQLLRSWNTGRDLEQMSNWGTWFWKSINFTRTNQIHEFSMNRNSYKSRWN